MSRKKIIVFFALISLGIYTGCSGQGQETEKSDTEQPEEFLQRESILYHKYQDALQEIDERREACLILGEDGWENAKDCYREFILDNLFGMCALYNAGSGYEMNECSCTVKKQKLKTRDRSPVPHYSEPKTKRPHHGNVHNRLWNPTLSFISFYYFLKFDLKYCIITYKMLT